MDQPALGAYRLIRYHRRGYGDSSRIEGPFSIVDQATDVAQLLEYLGVRRAHIAGHSYGGLIALQFAADRPEMTGSLALLGPALRDLTGGPASKDLARRMGRGVQLYQAGDREGGVDAFVAPVFGPDYRQHLDRLLPGSWLQAVRDSETFFTVEFPALQQWQFGEDQVRRINAPVLCITGSESDPAYFEMEQLLLRWFPHLETAHIAGANEMLQMQQPRAVAETLARFLARHPLS
jgi:3-oxoadipate enol-lactonase